MRTIDVRVAHQDHLAVTRRREVEVFKAATISRARPDHLNN